MSLSEGKTPTDRSPREAADLGRSDLAGPDLGSTVTVQPAEAPPAPFQTLAPGSRVGERYEILGVLGSGGSSVVYRARDRDLDREIALKTLRADRFGEETLKRFRREARVARDAASPRLVRIFDIGSTGDAVFLTLEAMEGGSLRQKIAEGPLDVEEAVRIAIQVFEGLETLHGLGIVHRDVKPANILLDAQGDIKLADFGLSRRWDCQETRVTQTDSLVGTLAYLSPEQVLGEEIDPRSDLYAAGLVLFEMLTGRLPHEEANTLGKLLRQMNKPLPGVHTFRPEAPAWLARLLARLLDRDRKRRYNRASEVLRDLRRRRAGWRMPRRWAWAAALAGLAAAATLAAIRLDEWPGSQGTRFAQLSTDRHGVRGISEVGTTLWELSDVGGSFQAATLSLGAPEAVVGIRQPYRDHVHKGLEVLDSETGESREIVPQASASEAFEALGYRDSYGVDIHAVDLDGDGVDEILLDYLHTPYWPSYSVLYEPKMKRSRVIFCASGHHRFAQAADLNGDGDKELLFVGTNNRTGWYKGLAAVQLVPPVNEEPRTTGRFLFSCSPDSHYLYSRNDGLLWYALLPTDTLQWEQSLKVRPTRKELRLRKANRGSATLGFDGFFVGSGLPEESETRQKARDSAFSDARDAQRLLLLPSPDEALEASRSGVALAAEAKDPVLEEWIRRLEGRALVAANRFDEAETLFREISNESTQKTEIAFDAATVFHLHGDLDRAITWYRQAYGRYAGSDFGRNKFELFSGLIFALTAKGDFDEALESVVIYERLYDEGAEAAEGLRAFIQWRETGNATAFSSSSESASDHHYYWSLEARRLRGHEPEDLLRQTRNHSWHHASAEALGLCLQGQLLADLGHYEEARITLTEALERAVNDPRNHLEYLPVFAHIEVIRERLATVEKTLDARAPETPL